MSAFAIGPDLTHVFVDKDGRLTDLDCAQQYTVIRTEFIPTQMSRSSSSSPQRIGNGTFYHYVAPVLTIAEDPI